MKIAICDDEPIALQKMQHLTASYFSRKHIATTIDCFLCGEQFLQSDCAAYDIILLDVNLKSMNGIDVALKFRNSNSHAILIYVSELVEYAPMGYETNAFRYIVKDHLDSTFEYNMDAALEKMGQQNFRYPIKTDAGNIMVPVNDIVYIESIKRKVIYRLQNSERTEYICNDSFSSLVNSLSRKGFLHIHRVYLVNMEHICCINRSHVILTGKIDLPISKQNSKEIIETYNCWIGTL